ncbi:MAG: DUF1800 domain-containing protein [Saprospiraceae bacterium]|nr:DUF1800 domain-containing protein [Saprospiraceae bacterium]
MNRRSLLKSVFTQRNTILNSTLCGQTSSLAPYTGTWTYETAAHLLKRAMFGPTHQQIKQAVTDGLDATIAKLFTTLPEPLPPVNPNNSNDPNVPIGSTWVDAPFDIDLANYRISSLLSWTMKELYNEQVNIREKMTLFWYNHFVTQGILDARIVYHNIKTYRQNALGNFKEFVKIVTIDPVMLTFLNGNESTKAAPNENYARELLELFTIGKGPQIAPGDYTNYTETDIQQMAKVLTGWRLNNAYIPGAVLNYGSFFTLNRHDTTTKVLSSKFNNTQIPNMGDQEYAFLIDTIFEQAEVARFICRKLYRYFVFSNINDTIEQNIIQPMANLLIANNYEITPVLQALLKSEHFFDIEMRGLIIKPPIDFLISTLKIFNIPLPNATNLAKQYNTFKNIYEATYALQQAYYDAPDVAGWKAYYQEPGYYHIWLSSVTLPLRIKIMNGLSTVGIPIAGTTYSIDVLNFIQIFDDPSDPNLLIADLIKLLFPFPLADSQILQLKAILLGGQSQDHYWTDAWVDYINNPSNPLFVNTVKTKLNILFYSLTGLSEYQLM